MSLAAALPLLYLLACLDGAFAGFRSAAGRNPRLDKRAWYRSAMLGGLAYSQGAALVVVASCAALAVPTDALFQGVLAMLQVYGLYAGAALLALAVYLVPHPDLSSLATVLVLGPLTLLRVPTILAGALWGALAAGEPRGAAGALVAGGVMAVAGPVLGLRWRGWEPLPEAP